MPEILADIQSESGFFLFPYLLGRQRRQRSLPHHWHEKQSRQGCFFFFFLHSGTKISPLLPGSCWKPIVLPIRYVLFLLNVLPDTGLIKGAAISFQSNCQCNNKKSSDGVESGPKCFLSVWFSPHFSPSSSREAGKGCGYEARAEKHPQAYCQYVEDVFQAKRSRRNACRLRSRSLVRNVG